jgi:hypothetical protein
MMTKPFLVRPAWVYSNGCKSLTHPDSTRKIKLTVGEGLNFI